MFGTSRKQREGKQEKKGNEWNLFTLRSAHVGPSASTWDLIPYVMYPLNLNANMSKKKGKTNYLLFSMLLQNESITYLIYLYVVRCEKRGKLLVLLLPQNETNILVAYFSFS